MDTSFKDRLLSKILIVGSCWEFQGALRSGYGALRVDGKIYGTHRLSWEIYFGKIPEGKFICHACDNRKCINPKHLFLGDPVDNVHDMIKKGRRHSSKGKKLRLSPNRPAPKNRRIDEDMAKQIKQRLNKGIGSTLISRELMVPLDCVKSIKRGWTFKFIEVD